MVSDADEPVAAPEGENPALGETVKAALIQIGDLRDLEDRAKAIMERVSKLTPPPEDPESKA